MRGTSVKLFPDGKAMDTVSSGLLNVQETKL
jgi:hypothetical protein